MATQETFEPVVQGHGPAASTHPRGDGPGGSDRELALSFQRGDRWAYESIYERYAPRVSAVCHRMLADPQDAQDAAQETFLRVYQALPRFNGRYHLGAWINRIATNVCLDQLRARSRAPADAAPNDVLEDVLEDTSGEGPEDVMMRSAEGARVQETLARLTPLQRTAILMRDFEGRAYTDIAASLGVSETRARVLLHRARKGFRRSWSAGWLVLGVPARLLRRLRGPVAEQVAQAANSAVNAGGAAASSAPVAACAHLAHGCGGFVVDRIAPTAAAAVLSAAAASGVGLSSSRDVVAAIAQPRAARVTSGELPEAVRAVQGQLAAMVELSAAAEGSRSDPSRAGPAQSPTAPVSDSATAGDAGAAPTAVAPPPAPANEGGTVPAADGTIDPVANDEAATAPADTDTQPEPELTPAPEASPSSDPDAPPEPPPSPPSDSGTTEPTSSAELPAEEQPEEQAAAGVPSPEATPVPTS
jgi:RNA polymerase sigma-70 factor (ECF subfamily)